MGVVTQEFDEFDIMIDPSAKLITIQQRWMYNWIVLHKPLGDWTYEEKKIFHNDIDKIIWKAWSSKYKSISRIRNVNELHPKDKFKDIFHNIEYEINFDIKWVLTNPHWFANIYKIYKPSDYRSNVNESKKEINLTWWDTINHSLEWGLEQNVVSHEYGHTLGAPDEYSRMYIGPQCKVYEYEQHFTPEGLDERFCYDWDKRSLMNIGNELRLRFVNNIDSKLDQMFSDVEFETLLK